MGNDRPVVAQGVSLSTERCVQEIKGGTDSSISGGATRRPVHVVVSPSVYSGLLLPLFLPLHHPLAMRVPMQHVLGKGE